MYFEIPLCHFNVEFNLSHVDFSVSHAYSWFHIRKFHVLCFYCTTRSGNGVKGAYLPVEIFARPLGENTTACPLTQ